MMRIVALALGTLLAVAFLVAVASPADAAGVCVADLYNNMGEPCHAVFCYGYTQGGWQTCVLPIPDPCFPEYCDPPL